MVLKVVFEQGATHRFRDHVGNVVGDAIRSHPFLADGVDLPQRLGIRINIDGGLRTSIQHDTFSETGEVVLNIDEFQLFVTRPGGGVICLDSDPPNDELPNIVAHELGHFIDACLNAAFRYKAGLRPTDETLLSRVYHLWDSYIDGRLGALAPYELQERVKEALEVGRLDASLVERAWHGAFKTYPELVEAASQAPK